MKKSIEKKKGESWRKGYQAGVDETLKACGGCRKCYGKGYGTSISFNEGVTDFGALETISKQNPLMVFCSCGRGKQLEFLIKTEGEIHHQTLQEHIKEETKKFLQGFAYKPKKKK